METPSNKTPNQHLIVNELLIQPTTYRTISTHRDIPKLLDYVNLERIFGLKRSTFSKLVMVNKFVPVVKIGNKNYFKTVDVEAWIDKQTQAIAQ